jgi:hypothetical protein
VGFARAQSKYVVAWYDDSDESTAFQKFTFREAPPSHGGSPARDP